MQKAAAKHPPSAPAAPTLAGPSFYVTPKQKITPGSLLLALILASAILLAVLHAQTRARQSAANGSDDDDPSQVDTIYLGDPGQAPVIKRPATQPSTVHPFVVVHLPRDGNGFGQIPDTPTGHLLYNWLDAFNAPNPSTTLAHALPAPEDDSVQAAELDLRKLTGGFTLLSSKEVQPGLLVFRLRDQTPSGNEVLGTLTLRESSTPPTIATFSLRQVPPPPQPATR